MTYTCTLYFLGKFRPLSIEDTSPARVKIRVSHAIQDTAPELRDWLSNTSAKVFSEFSRMGYSSVSYDDCARGLALRTGPHDPWLDHIVAELPKCPGLNYNA